MEIESDISKLVVPEKIPAARSLFQIVTNEGRVLPGSSGQIPEVLADITQGTDRFIPSGEASTL